jgi:hypothetical protein
MNRVCLRTGTRKAMSRSWEHDLNRCGHERR